jgi:outer membrane biosynthesis protein TonB
MSGFWRRVACIFGVVGSLASAPAGAQENLDSGKSGAQLFASNCTLCHKSAQALRKSGGPLGLSGFLREHYTSSRESAAIIATYLESFGTPPAPGKRTGATKRTGKGDEKAKDDEKKAEPKSGETKSVKPDKTDKPPEAKTSEPKTSEPKSEPKPPDAKASEPKPDAAPAAKPDKPEKSD